MAIGTAGYTAMLSVLALEHGGLTPQRGDILVTGANGGVGSIAIAILSDLGYRVVASTGRREADYLRSLGAADIIDRRTPSSQEHRSRAKDGLRSGLRRQSYARERWRRLNIAAWSRPAAWLKVWIFPDRSCPSSCATSPLPVSTR